MCWTRNVGVVLVVAEVPELDVSSKPCFYRGAGVTQGSYVRVSDGDRHLSSYEVQMMLVKHGQPRDDEDPVPGTGIDDLDPRLVAEFLARLRQSRPYAFADLDDAPALRRAKVIVGAEGVVSLAGLLALARFPQEHFPQLTMSFVHYPTIDGADLVSGERFSDNVVLEGPIPVMVRDGMAVLRRNMSRRAIVRGAGREDAWEYPEAALREVIVNALVPGTCRRRREARRRRSRCTRIGSWCGTPEGCSGPSRSTGWVRRASRPCGTAC